MLPTLFMMRLSKEQIEKICRLILDNLKKKGLVSLKVSEQAVVERMIEIFTADIKKEDDLDREVERILSQHSGQIESGRIDYRKMFNMIKHKLAKERGIVL